MAAVMLRHSVRAFIASPSLYVAANRAAARVVAPSSMSSLVRLASTAASTPASSAAPNVADYHVKIRIPKWEQKWITREAEIIMAKAYARHHALGDNSDRFPERPSRAELESIVPFPHYEPRTLTDKTAMVLVRMLRPLVHMFFKERYMSHACVLETVAACPGVVAAAMRHFHSLRNMQRDHGWLHTLWEEAENERMHLLIWMSLMAPTRFERTLVVLAQTVYITAYAAMYAFVPKMAHRFVGYLEEEATSAYTDLLRSIDSGAVVNVPAPEIARKYYNLPHDAKLRDVVLYVRADETMHALVNHRLSEILDKDGRDAEPDVPPMHPEIELLEPNHPKRIAKRGSVDA